MASGDITYTTGDTFGAVLLDAVDGTATNDGAWIDCRGFKSGTITVTGVASLAICTIYGSNALAKPANTVNTGAMNITGNPTTAATNPTVTIPVLPRFIKIGITTLGTGTVSANLCARKF